MRGTVKCVEVGSLVLAQQPRFKVGVNRKLVPPILKKPLLGDDDDGVENVFAKPVEHKIDSDLGLSQALLMEDGRVRKILYGFKGLDLVHESLVLRCEIRNVMYDQHATLPSKIVENYGADRLRTCTRAQRFDNGVCSARGLPWDCEDKNATVLLPKVRHVGPDLIQGMLAFEIVGGLRLSDNDHGHRRIKRKDVGYISGDPAWLFRMKRSRGIIEDSKRRKMAVFPLDIADNHLNKFRMLTRLTQSPCSRRLLFLAELIRQ